MIFVANGVFCQINTGKMPMTKPPLRLISEYQSSRIPLIAGYFNVGKENKLIQPGMVHKPAISLNPVPYFVISSDHYAQSFGFFCKKELQFEKATKVPFKFRLGSVPYCDWMEGKPNAGILPGY